LLAIFLKLNAQISTAIPGYHTATDFFKPRSLHKQEFAKDRRRFIKPAMASDMILHILISIIPIQTTNRPVRKHCILYAAIYAEKFLSVTIVNQRVIQPQCFTLAWFAINH
jgi:hypothetical protein